MTGATGDDHFTVCNSGKDRFVPDTIDEPSMADMRRKALSRWDNEGGAERHDPAHAAPPAAHANVPPLTNAELVQLRIRVIALENLLIMVLAEGSDRQREKAREMADYIAPRPGHTHHPLTLQAGSHMIDLVDRAVHYRHREGS